MRELCEHLSTCRVIGIDTEFIHKNSYYAKLALIQIATQKQIFIIDPIAITQSKALVQVLKNPNILKIMHSPSQDKEVLKRSYRIITKPIFDTQLASSFLSDEDQQVSYQKLVATIIGQDIAKLYTVSNWLRRPLSKAQLSYAAQDVAFLIPLYKALKTLLRQNGKLQWFEEESQWREDKMQNYPARFLESIEHMPANMFAVYKNLIQWREHKAQQQDLPRQWIASNGNIKKIVVAWCQHSKLSLKTLQEIIEIKRQPASRVKEYAQEIGTLLAQIKPYQETSKKKLDQAYQQQLGELVAVVNDIASKRHIPPPLLATKQQLSKIARGSSYQKVLPCRWQHELLADALQSLPKLQ